jgi:hypothetical protein
VSEAGSPISERRTFAIPGAFQSDDEDDVEWQTPGPGPFDPFMTANDEFKPQLLTQNPWRTLARFRNPLKQEDVGIYSRFPLLQMPIELLMMVVAHLPIESVACLALACKKTYFALGTASFEMPQSSLWKFLLLIEHERQSAFACARCLTLHRPPQSSFFNHYRCSKNRLWRLRMFDVMQLNLPRHITPGLVKLIGRKHFEDPRACQEFLSWAIWSAKKTTRYIKLATHVIPRMTGGSLLLQTETYIHAFAGGHLTERSLIELATHVGDGNSFLSKSLIPNLCGHEDWKHHLPNLAALKKYVMPTKCSVGNNDDKHYHRASCYSNAKIVRYGGMGGQDYPVDMCDIIHEQPCRMWKAVVPSNRTRLPEDKEARKAFRPTVRDNFDGDIKGCRQCFTDFAVSASEVPGVGPCLVLTTWKDLGGVGPGFSDKWDRHIKTNHTAFARYREKGDCRTGDQVGQAYEAFEKLERSYLDTPQRYRPQPSRKMVRDLTRRVHKRHWGRKDDTTDTEASTEVDMDRSICDDVVL